MLVTVGEADPLIPVSYVKSCLDAIGGPDSWRMFGTGGDAKGQPTQTNSISHGSPYIRIKKIMVGAAYA